MDGFSDRRSHPSSSFRGGNAGEAAVLKRGAMHSGHLATYDDKRDATSAWNAVVTPSFSAIVG
jgi:hypothetical protein